VASFRHAWSSVSLTSTIFPLRAFSAQLTLWTEAGQLRLDFFHQVELLQDRLAIAERFKQTLNCDPSREMR